MKSRRIEKRPTRGVNHTGRDSNADNKAVHSRDNRSSAEQAVLEKSLEKNIAIVQRIFSGDDSVVFRRFQNRYLEQAKCCIVFVEGMIDYKHINHHIIEPVLQQNLGQQMSKNNLLEDIQYKVLEVNNVELSGDLKKMVQAVCYGDTIFLLDGYDKALIIESKGWETRAITEPASEKSLRGPREGFTENFQTNISLLRRIIKNPKLKFNFMELGKQTHTLVCISYIEGLALDSVLVELKQRLNRIDIDAVLDSGYIQELIRDEPISPFQTVGYSERPDVISSKLLEGRVAILVDGSPGVLTVPYIIIEGAQANEDYYSHFLFGSFNRLLRVTAAIITISLPALFLALVTYHQEMLPTQLLISISASLEGVPLPTSLSLAVMLVVFDVLREAGTRMPLAVGQAINIVGTLVLGQAAVEARLVSAPVVIITAVSGITTLMLPPFLESIVILRLLLLLCASFLGLYGYVFGMLLILLHLMGIRSFGVPYMMGIASMKNHDGQDALIRSPWWTMTLRPKIIGARNLVRQKSRHNKEN